MAEEMAEEMTEEAVAGVYPSFITTD